jgi:hypothetical protein
MDLSGDVVERFRYMIRVQRLALCFIHYREAVQVIKRTSPDAPVEWLPPGFSRAVFQDRGFTRDIDLLWIGRRHAPLHAALLRLSDETGYTYRYSRHRRDPATSDELSELVARARYFVVTPPGRERTGAFNPLSMRYLEGLGGGARLLGVLPLSGEFQDLFPMDAIVECAADGSDLATVLAEADADRRWEEKRVSARDLVHQFHGWESRAKHIYDRIMSLEGGAGASASVSATFGGSARRSHASRQ